MPAFAFLILCESQALIRFSIDLICTVVAVTDPLHRKFTRHRRLQLFVYVFGLSRNAKKSVLRDSMCLSAFSPQFHTLLAKGLRAWDQQENSTDIVLKLCFLIQT
jgi:hypothetical protein